MRVTPILPIIPSARVPARRVHPQQPIKKEQNHDNRNKEAQGFRLAEPQPSIGDWVYGRPER